MIDFLEEKACCGIPVGTDSVCESVMGMGNEMKAIRDSNDVGNGVSRKFSKSRNSNTKVRTSLNRWSNRYRG